MALALLLVAAVNDNQLHLERAIIVLLPKLCYIRVQKSIRALDVYFSEQGACERYFDSAISNAHH